MRQKGTEPGLERASGAGKEEEKAKKITTEFVLLFPTLPLPTENDQQTTVGQLQNRTCVCVHVCLCMRTLFMCTLHVCVRFYLYVHWRYNTSYSYLPVCRCVRLDGMHE